MPIHRYILYGFRLDSFLPFPGLESGEGPAEVEIRCGPVPDELPDARERGVLFQAAPGKFRLAIDEVAAYLVKEGREVVVEPSPQAGEDDVRVFLAGSVMGALLYQRGFLPLHASAIEVGGRCVAFAGHSGDGKSTLAAAFHQRGYRVLADDVLAVRARSDGTAIAYPGYPELKLWADALAKLELDREGLCEIRAGSEKSRFPTGEVAGREPLALSHVYLLSAINEDRFEIEPVEGMGKLDVLTEYTYRRRLLEGLGVKQNHFRLCVAVSRGSRILRVIRPRAGFQLQELARLLEGDFLH